VFGDWSRRVIGSHLVENAGKSGADVRAFCAYRRERFVGLARSLGPEKNDIDVVAGDLRDRDNVSAAMEGRRCGLPFLAGLIAFRFSYDARHLMCGPTSKERSMCFSRA